MRPVVNGKYDGYEDVGMVMSMMECFHGNEDRGYEWWDG